MANEFVNVTQGTGTKMAADQIGDVYHPRVKIEIGDEGSAADVSSANPMPVTSSGLTLGGLVTVVAINDTTWTPLPATPLAKRNELNIQNDSGFDLKLNYNSFSALPLGYVGITIANGNERQYPIKDSVVIFAKAAPGSGTVNITVGRNRMTTGLVTRPIVSVETAGSTTPIIANVTCVNGGVEYSYILPIGCQGYMIQPRKGMGDLKISYVSGQSGTNYVYLPPNTFRSIGGLQTTTLVTIYFQSSVSGTIVEIETWT